MDSDVTGGEMTFDQLSFVTYCVGALSDTLNMSASQVYRLLRQSGILKDYILPGYGVLVYCGRFNHLHERERCIVMKLYHASNCVIEFSSTICWVQGNHKRNKRC
jgi:hypothetical protein